MISSSLNEMSPFQRIVLTVALVVALFLLFGTFLHDSQTAGGPSFGVQSQSFLVLALLAFAGGMFSFASPCTLPILPAYFAFAFQSGRRQIATNTVAFMLGLATMFSLLGAGASIIGQVLRQNTDLLLLLGGSLILIFGVMSLLGKGFTGFVQNDGGERSTTTGGSYMFGLTFAVGWTSCTGPILGAVLTLAATTGSVLSGVMLLFIYTLGLGLPLLIVSTLFGRASRKSLFWRILRGKGQTVTVPALAVGAVWAVIIWRILVAAANYVLSPFNTLLSRPLATWQEWALLAVAIAGVALWYATGNVRKRIALNLHSTQLISGVLFIILGILMINGTLSRLNSILGASESFLTEIEYFLYDFFAR
ncbi:MAG: cytochrome c biogenesis CcdA family protein [Candidatus Promineifilaceae bacterium]|nr:cytochrome c biogenesis CcdA family protein [Candidatus Promineifilaceae bacterium]